MIEEHRPNEWDVREPGNGPDRKTVGAVEILVDVKDLGCQELRHRRAEGDNHHADDDLVGLVAKCHHGENPAE